MTASDWQSFQTDGPPQVGQRVLLLIETSQFIMICKWDNPGKAISPWTHWKLYTPPAKEDGFEVSDTGKNTDREIWRKQPGDYYSPSIHVTESGGIGMDVGGHVIVAPIERWHEAGELLLCVNPCLPEWRRKLALWLLNVRLKGCKE